MPDRLALRERPDWDRAAQVLVDGCAHAPDDAYRIDLVERLALALGDALYPAFLNVLQVVGERGSPAAQQGVADALADALRDGRLPAGRRGAWGVAGPAGAALGPVEYLCAWAADVQAADRPAPLEFERRLVALLRLVSQSPRAARMYAARLLDLAHEPLDGTLRRDVRAALAALAQAWREGASPADAADAAQRALHGGSALGALAPPAQPPLRDSP